MNSGQVVRPDADLGDLRRFASGHIGLQARYGSIIVYAQLACLTLIKLFKMNDERYCVMEDCISLKGSPKCCC